MYNGQQVFDFLVSLLGEEQVLFFPMDELLRSESLAASKEMLTQRLYVLSKLQENTPKIIVTNLAAALRYLPEPKYFSDQTLRLKVGNSYSIEEIKRTLIRSGYTRVNKIDQTLQFALRGDILDIFSVNTTNPVRIEFFDEEIESIRVFDLATQTSYQEIASVEVYPATDLLLSEENAKQLVEKIKEQITKDKKHLSGIGIEKLDMHIDEDIERILSYDYSSKLYKYYGFAGEKAFSIIDYINKPIVIVANHDQFIIHERMLHEEAIKYLIELQENGQNISHLQLYQTSNNILSHAERCIYFYENRENENDMFLLVRPIIGQSTNLDGALNLISTYHNQGKRILIAVENLKQGALFVKTLQSQNIEFEQLTGLEIPSKNIGITLFNLEHGFELADFNLVVLTMNELLSHRTQSSRFVSRFREATILRSYEDLQPGDYVVHEIYGVGQFADINTLLIDDVHRDYLHIDFAAGDVLYVPLAQFHLVRKFIGREGAAPKLNRLNTNEWERTKKRIKSRVKDIAEELVKLYSLRAKKPGYAFPPDDELQLSFENQFPFELTPDQRVALKEIKQDMEKDEPMDRLLCGDVGFGKTELAFRAAFKAISAGKQVAILCPTTLLARQHYEVARDRFASFGIHIAHLSRLVLDSEQNQAISNINAGKIDLVIGTHRLLSKEIKYPNLGLLVVDEEQRFGVEQKEKIKGIKVDVDVLTLSATPIPRTLQMSLIGIREISQINTPPNSRMPIQTYVMGYRKEVVRELLERELARHGQVFYLHNQVDSILSKARQIQDMLPQARIGVVHGQMNRDSIEDVMLKFYQNEIDILVSTTIIENGIDVPNANLIIIENADKFGLAQLYQIKGRVGRGNRIAYAYLLYNPQKNINEIARKRLKSIQDFTELGSGYKIAQRDLMIRGAGDILGAEQAGFIETVGIDMYMKLLNEAIREEKTGVPVVEEQVRSAPNLSVDAYIPNEYATKFDKIDLYKRIGACKSHQELAVVEGELRDIYGRIPEQTRMLLRQQALDINMQSEEFVGLEENSNSITLTLSNKFMRIPRIGTELFERINKYQSQLKVRVVGRELMIYINKNNAWFEILEKTVFEIHKLYEKHQGETYAN
ncbi:MAG: transcription-repair coupling factor [Bacilli bacterium]